MKVREGFEFEDISNARRDISPGWVAAGFMVFIAIGLVLFAAGIAFNVGAFY